MSLDQMASPLLELLQKLKELANVQEMQEMGGVENLPEFRNIIYQLCQEAPVVAQAIAVTIQENITSHESPAQRPIPDSSHRLSSKRKRKEDPSYQPSHPIQSDSKKRCIDNMDEPMTPKTPILEKESAETQDATESTSCIDTPKVNSTSRQEGEPEVQPSDSTAFPGTEDVHHATMPTSLDSEQKGSRPMPGENFTEDVSFLDRVYHAINIVNQLKKYPNGLPRTVHIQILQTFQTDQKTDIESNHDHWSDGKMWMEVLKGGSAANRRCTILNMLEYMGASKWYDSQIELARRTVCTKENKAVVHKGAAAHVLDRITSEHSLLNRKVVTNQLSRGKKLRTKLVKSLGLGILFSPKIWDYTKRSMPQLDLLVKNFQADTQHVALLQILSAQVEQLVRCGSTNPEALYNSLREYDLVSEEELVKIRASYSSEHDVLPEGTLNAAVDQLISRVSTQIFNKQSLDDRDIFTIHESMKSPGDLFHRLRPGQWLDSWVLRVAMHISDRPTSVRFSESIPVDHVGRHGRIRPTKKPFQAWVKKIAQLRKEAEGHTPLTFYSPIHHTNSHFTLLEINDSEKVIRHYDSLAAPTTIDGTTKTRIADLVEDEFGDLGYRYIEAPTPQQDDDWSCGARVICNFRQRCNGFDIGSWDTVLDSERILLDIVNGLIRCIDSNAMRKYSRNSKCGVTTTKSPKSNDVEELPCLEVLSEAGSNQGSADIICID